MKSLLGKLGVIIMIIGFVLLSVSSANAGPSLKDYKILKDTETFRKYLYGVGQGFQFADVENLARGQSLLFCPPPKLAITEENYLRILQDYIERHKEIKEDAPIAYLLLLGLVEAFPCK